MAAKKTFKLRKRQKAQLIKLVRTGTEKARVIRRAQILLALDAGETRQDIAKQYHCGVATVGRTKRDFLAKGVDEALYETERSGRPVVYGECVKKKIIALACSDPPCGRSRWTLSLLAEYCTEQKPPARSTVCMVLREASIQPWRKKNVVHC